VKCSYDKRKEVTWLLTWCYFVNAEAQPYALYFLWTNCEYISGSFSCAPLQKKTQSLSSFSIRIIF